MGRRAIVRFCPGVERFEEKQLLSAGAATAHRRAANVGAAPAALAPNPAPAPGTPRRRGTAGIGFLAFRVTQKPYPMHPPFQQVLVQKAQPVPGKVYNVLYIAVRNQTFQTFTASSGLTVRIPGFTGTRRVPGNSFPVLTGDETWKPNQVIVFYILGKKYYPLSPQVAAGFQLNLGGRSSTLVPGPSAIALRIKYNPATFANTLNWIVAFGQGAQVGRGPQFGIPDTAINAFVRASTNRIDYGGHF
jgi:hypothetical protein